jgi:hypothetical protein
MLRASARVRFWGRIRLAVRYREGARFGVRTEARVSVREKGTIPFFAYNLGLSAITTSLGKDKDNSFLFNSGTWLSCWYNSAGSARRALNRAAILGPSTNRSIWPGGGTASADRGSTLLAFTRPIPTFADKLAIASHPRIFLFATARKLPHPQPLRNSYPLFFCPTPNFFAQSATPVPLAPTPVS